jgi:DNA-binding response OmpR family regulator
MAPPRPVQLRPSARKPVQQIRVLVVEDVRTVAISVQAVLLQAGMEVEIAETGAEAWERKQEFRPDIALIDLGLPDVEGFDLEQKPSDMNQIGFPDAVEM